MKKPLNWLILLALAVATVLIVKHDGATWYTNQGQVFGTFYKITYQHNRDIQPLIVARLRDVDNSLSPFNPQSVITRLNRGESQQTDTLFRTVYRKAREVYALSGGAFDITVAPLVNAWGFGFKDAATVTPALIDSLRTFVGMQGTRLRGTLFEKDDPRTLLDCSAIAKGFGSDCVAALFDSLRIRNYMVEIGGEVVVRGINSKGHAWRIGVNKPTEDSLVITNELDTILALTDCAMATSGNYRNFYYRDGQRFAHTIDPRTGYPVQHSVLSATVIAPTCMEADALATSIMVLGLDSARAMLATLPHVSAYLIVGDGPDDTRSVTIP
ncbi:MAG: FAD:protein FMN transferase [Bacteroidaceae bacterium]|nr:FAD:protein FMN transferase [Bacteroidaceae bacterium]